jgi:transcriptional antiterminator Rof (Rho-off)
MSPEEYAALLASGKVELRRDPDNNYIYVAVETTTAVLPRDIIEQLKRQQFAAIAAHEARMKAFDVFIAALQATK